MKESNKKTQALIQQLLGLAYEITTETATDVFINYAAHVHEIQVSIYPGGWKMYKSPARDIRIGLNPNWQRKTATEIHDALQKEIDYLEFLKQIKKGEEKWI